jgi:HD-like signal output (HDOD) protein
VTVTRILFVDDEVHVLDGLRDLLRRQRRDWDMVMALGGAAALRELDAGAPFDVVVSDMRMPDIDGATLLEHVRDRSPETVRIVLSGQTELDAALSAVPVAHQFLAKPCDRDELVGAIERGLRTRAPLADASVRAAAGGAHRLPSAPALYTRLVEASADPDVTMSEIAALVEADIAMSAKVLQLVSSPFFGLGRKVTTARDAVAYLGLAPLQALVLSAGTFSQFAPTELPGFDIAGLEAHSARVARVAAALLPDKAASAEAFTAGMLHDVGILVRATRQPEAFADVLAESERSGRAIHDIEKERGEVTHAEIGGYLLGLWGLPQSIVAAVTGHHDPAQLELGRLDPAAAVYLANAALSGVEVDAAPLGAADRLAAAVHAAAERDS